MSGERSPVGAVVLLDANVLYPIAVCDFLLTASSLQLLARPIVTREIMEEAIRNLVIDRPDLGEQRIHRRFDAVRAATDGYHAGPRRRFAGDQLINEKDRHVVAAALRHQVDLLVTNDVRLRAEIDQMRSLRGDAARPVSPISTNELVAELITAAPDEVAAVVGEMAQRLRSPKRTPNDVARALIRHLPALDALGLDG